MKKADKFITLAVISGAHGIKGAMKVKSFSDSDLQHYALHDASGTAFPLKVIGEAKGQLICTLKGIQYRDEAEKLKGTALGVMRSQLPAPPEDECYIEDLIGMQAMLEDGKSYGTVKAVHNFGAGDILEIGNEMISFSQSTVPEVDFAKGQLTLRLPEILKGDD